MQDVTTRSAALGLALLFGAGCVGEMSDASPGEDDGTDAGRPVDAGATVEPDGGAPPGEDAGSAATPERKEASLGLGLAGVADWSTQYPFVDFMKQSRRWQDWQNGGEEVTGVDERGWVTSLEPGQTAGTVFLTIPEGVPVTYPRFVVRWRGTGTLSYQWSARKVGERDGGDLVEVTEGSSLLQIDSTDPTDPIRDITIVPEASIDAFDAGAVFNPDFLSLVRDFRAVRFMDWMRTNGSLQERWSDRPVPGDRTWAVKGVPAEILVALANELNADAWLNVPHLADAEYIRELATVVRDGLAPHLLAYVEHSNEVWNWGFEQAQHANEAGRARWGDVGNAYMQWHGMRTATVCDIWKQDVFGAEAHRVRCVLGTQAGWRGLEEGALDCPLWVAEEEGRQPCFEHGIDALGITGYFSGCLHGRSGDGDYTDVIRGWFADDDGGLTRGMEQLADGRHFACGDTIAGKADQYAYFRDVAESRGLALVAYEGGQHITGNGHAVQDDPAFIQFHIAINRDARMRERYLDDLRHWREQGGTLFMHFVDVSHPSKWGSWGALEHLGQTTSPKWEALHEVNAMPCWWDGC